MLFHLIHGSPTSIQSYISDSKMDLWGRWCSDIEILTLAHMLQTDIYSYNTEDLKWHKYGFADVDRNASDDVSRISIYIRHPQSMCSHSDPKWHLELFALTCS